MSRRCRRQRGDALLEALVGVLIAAIIGAGMASVMTSVMRGQTNSKIEFLAVNEMHMVLDAQGGALCDAAPGGSASAPEIHLGGKTAAVAVSCAEQLPLAVNVGGHSRQVTPPRNVTLTVAPEDIGLDQGSPAIAVGTHQ